MKNREITFYGNKEQVKKFQKIMNLSKLKYKQ